MIDSFVASASASGIAGRTLEEWQAFARRDDCLDLMVPSDLRQLIGALVAAEIRRLDMADKATRDGYPNMIEWLREYRFRTKDTLKAAKDAYEANAPMPSLVEQPIGPLDGWQDISTVPRDATVLVAVVATPKNRAFFGKRPPDVYSTYVDENGRFETDDNNPYWKHTHWMPFPPPPSTLESGKADLADANPKASP